MYMISNKQWAEVITLLEAYAAEPSDGSTIAKNKRRRALLLARKLRTKVKVVRSPPLR